jgi:hypothetical protein
LLARPGILKAVASCVVVTFCGFLAVVCVGVASVIWFVRSSPPRPSDATLIENFWMHEAQFRLLVNMSAEDSQVTRIADNFTQLASSVAWPRPADQIGFSEERWNQYRALFKEIGLQEGIFRRDGEVLFVYWAAGLSVTGAEKGYVYTTRPVEPVFDSLDQIPVPVKSLQAGYRPIAENWYLYYMWDD